VTVAIVIMVGAGAASGVLANIPFVAVMLVMVKGYLVTAEWLPEIALAPTFADSPLQVMPVFVAMRFAATLGGNATLIGASANAVSVGICAAQAKPVSFLTFMRYGLPLMLAQLAVSALYVLGLFYSTGR
jgi:Na+/H+ antiporter NhaD/arsenite permease-like protein